MWSYMAYTGEVTRVLITCTVYSYKLDITRHNKLLRHFGVIEFRLLLTKVHRIEGYSVTL